jgi:hypothetical protein
MKYAINTLLRWINLASVNELRLADAKLRRMAKRAQRTKELERQIAHLRCQNADRALQIDHFYEEVGQLRGTIEMLKAERDEAELKALSNRNEKE